MSLGVSIDSSLESNEEIRFKYKHRHLVKNLANKYPFTYSEVEALVVLYYKVWKKGNQSKVTITREEVKDFLHSGLDMTDQKLSPYYISAFSKRIRHDISISNWVGLMALYLRGTLDQKIKYCFKVYQNYTMQEILLRRHVVKLLSKTLIYDTSEEREEQVKDLADLLIKKVDVNRDGKISFEDYQTTVKNNPLLLEVFGPCLPKRTAIHSFLSTISKTVGKK